VIEVEGSRLLELQGSEVAGIRVEAGVLRVRIAAASARRDGEDGFLLGTSLCFSDARWQGDLAVCFGTVARAQVVHAGNRHLRLPVDFMSSSAVDAEFVFHNGECLNVRAAGLTVEMPGDARWLPSLAC
jgi:hypothetical protein